MTMGEKIIAINKDQHGDIKEVMTHTGRIISIEQAIQEAREGKFDSIAALDKEGNWYIPNSAGDGEPEYGSNLDILPSIESVQAQGDTTEDNFTP
jgi:hypothetical protein